jgi:hypothetical protein
VTKYLRKQLTEGVAEQSSSCHGGQKVERERERIFGFFLSSFYSIQTPRL